jgi:hypothetical protein
MSDRPVDGVAFGRLLEAVERIDANVTDHGRELAAIKQTLAEQAGEKRALKFFYSAGGAALTGLTAAALKLAGVIHLAGSGAPK